MAKVNYMSQEGLDKLKEELNTLKTKGRADIAKQIAEAREKGDLSENAEYDAAKEAQGLLELKISKLNEAVGTARVLESDDLDDSKALILSTVEIKNVQNNKVFTYTLVSEEEADLKNGKLSVSSPIGKGLLGKTVGEISVISTPTGVSIEFEILSISR